MKKSYTDIDSENLFFLYMEFERAWWSSFLVYRIETTCIAIIE